MNKNSSLQTSSELIFNFIQQPEVSHHQLAVDIKKMSDFFIQNPDGKTPWSENYCQNAYKYYYLPLNFIRNFEVLNRLKQVAFFQMLKEQNVETFVDWGCGPTTASLALNFFKQQNSDLFNISKQILIDHSEVVLKSFSNLHTPLINKETHTDFNLKNLKAPKSKSVLICSYSLTEVETLPTGYEDFHTIIILEPSTQQDGRKLLELREKLIQQKYFIWAPCTHSNKCPLLHESKHDWCHDRYHVQAPDWFKKTEGLLPFKNNTVTTSYLVISKTKPTNHLTNQARVTGDSLNEKGKTRQLICRDQSGISQREFLTWMHKAIEPETIPRGELIQLPTNENLEKKSNELRLKVKINK